MVEFGEPLEADVWIERRELLKLGRRGVKGAAVLFGFV